MFFTKVGRSVSTTPTQARYVIYHPLDHGPLRRRYVQHGPGDRHPHPQTRQMRMVMVPALVPRKSTVRTSSLCKAREGAEWKSVECERGNGSSRGREHG